MKVGTDGVLLGAWASAANGADVRHVADIGAGTGVISLMLAQRYADALVTGIEVDADAANECAENFAASPWSDRLECVATALQDFVTPAHYDLIVSNPPFYNATLKPTDQARATARHKDALPIKDLAQFAREHLNPHGRLALIYPTDYDTEVMTACAMAGLSARHLCDVLTKAGKPCKRRMAAFGLTSEATSPLQRQTLCIRHADGNYSKEYIALCNDFYTHLNG